MWSPFCPPCCSQAASVHLPHSRESDPLRGRVRSQSSSFQSSPMASPLTQNSTQCSSLHGPLCLVSYQYCHLFPPHQPPGSSSHMHRAPSFAPSPFASLACRHPQSAHFLSCLISKPVLPSQRNFPCHLIINRMPQISSLFSLFLPCTSLSFIPWVRHYLINIYLFIFHFSNKTCVS